MEASENQGLITEILSGAATLLELGGPVVGILLAASVLGLALALVKFIQFSGVGRSAMERMDKAIDLWQNGDHTKAVKMLDGSRLSIAADMRYGLEKKRERDGEILPEVSNARSQR